MHHVKRIKKRGGGELEELTAIEQQRTRDIHAR